MPKSVSNTVASNVAQHATRPLYIVEWEHSGLTELLSAGESVTYDSRLFQGGGINVDRIMDSKTATLSLPATSDRVSQIQNGSWRGGICKIWALPALPDGTEIFAAEDGILMIDGEIRSSGLTRNTITVSITHKNLSRKLSPNYTFDSVTAFSPAPGTVITWEGEKLVLESRR